MKRILRTLPVLLFIAFTVNAKSVTAQKTFESAVQLNNFLTDISDSMYQRGRALGIAINASLTKMDFTEFAAKRKDTEKFAMKKLEEVKSMTNYGGSEDLQKSMLEFLKFEIKLMREAFIPFEKLDAKSTKDDIKAAIKKITDLAAEENEFIENLRVTQEAYGKRNGFTIEDNN